MIQDLKKMPTIKKIDFTLEDEVSVLLHRLRQEFPLSKSTYQVVKDIRDGLIDANVFTDDWPHFTTVVSQEFLPKLSEIADIRIYTKDKHKVMHVLDEARLLDKPGNRQFIHVFSDNGDKTGLIKHLSEALKQHSLVQEQGLSLMVNSYPVLSLPESFGEIPTTEPAPGYVIKDLRFEHMRLVAEKWNLKHWYTEYLPLEVKISFVNSLYGRYTAIGMFPADDPTAPPVCWVLRKPGGYNGLIYTVKDERSKSHGACLTRHISKRVWNEGNVILHETRLPTHEMARIGESHVIVLIKDSKLPTSKL